MEAYRATLDDLLRRRLLTPEQHTAAIAALGAVPGEPAVRQPGPVEAPANAGNPPGPPPAPAPEVGPVAADPGLAAVSVSAEVQAPQPGSDNRQQPAPAAGTRLATGVGVCAPARLSITVAASTSAESSAGADAADDASSTVGDHSIFDISSVS